MNEVSATDIRARLAGLSDPLDFLTGLFAHSPFGLQIYKADGHCLLVNQAFRDLFGTEPPPEYNVLGDDIAEAQGILPLIRRAFAGETVHTPIIWYDPRDLKQVHVTEGRRVAISATFFPLFDATGAVSHVALLFKDVTTEVERQELVFGVLGHDLRNPLSAIGMAAAMLLRHGLDPKQADLVTQIRRSADRMTRMITDLLDFTRLREGGALPLKRQPGVALRSLCEEVVAELALSHPDRTITLDASVEGFGELDPDRIAQAVSNLVGNAVQHSPRGATVAVRLDERGDRTRLAITNAGPAIAPTLLARLFEPFRRGDSARGGGLGLGLYIVEQIVRAHGGSIGVTSDESGTTFTVELPRGA